jgi:L-ribulose-5-phosphate 4-epimerase
MLEDLRQAVWQANLDLVKYNLVILTWGNVSAIDREHGLVAIKPSGVEYGELKPSDIVIVNLEGTRIDGVLNPSSDTATHLALYKAFKDINAITHTHSEYATIFAQSEMEIPCLGTTHADYFPGPVPVTRILSEAEVRDDYEGNTGKVIIERFSNLVPLEMPAVLVAGHGPFTWGTSASEAVKNSLILESVAKMAFGTIFLNKNKGALPKYIIKKHYDRKHGPGAYYGQNRKL